MAMNYGFGGDLRDRLLDNNSCKYKKEIMN